MADLNKIIDELSKLTVVEAAELSKQLEEKWGVRALAPVAAPAAAGSAPAAEEKSEFIIDGETPSYVDMPVWYTHNIQNIGATCWACR